MEPMPETPKRTDKEIWEAILVTACTLDELGYHYAFFGSAACYIYGNTLSSYRYLEEGVRLPNDLDVVISDNRKLDAEQIKVQLTEYDFRFYTVAARDPNAKYRPLHFAR
ncbi:hypothetical protein Moror_12091 [Moniliophthora roreri MCA 2997]|uniref:Uncharacterized protein n=2 Tax=Moniliophthora roreri TaxID=221103 RepID=V2WTM2_MONRO|nr:hypothetical protein Moror_12091 [Moniliophthora roreri MCA 2997]